MREPVRILVGDVLDGLGAIEAGSVHCCVTSPPYWQLRDYGVEGQIGLEATPEAFVAKMVEVFRAVRRVLREDGTLWLNLGDSYNAYNGNRGKSHGENKNHLEIMPRLPQGAGLVCDALKPKDLMMMPWRVALALQADGWWLRSVICWAKKSPMPESVTDRPTSSWEPIFLLAKSSTYFYDAEAVKEVSESTGGAAFGKVEKLDEAKAAGQGARRYERPDYREIGRNQRNVWHLGPEPYPEAHFATFPSEIPRRAIKAGTSEKGCCGVCGAPWRRVVERTSMVIAPSGRDGRMPGNGMRSTSGAMVEPPTSKTTGWEPTCSHRESECVPCLVLDPFLGSGTTIAVARELGRHGVGCELNPEYVQLARARIGKAEKPSTYRNEHKVDDAPLFAGDSAEVKA